MSHVSKKTGGRMWHEARKQEKKIRGMLVDYRRRAERRRDYYERIKSDPTQFLQLHGRPCRIHLDPLIAVAGDSPANMMPWQGNADNLIDRFDVRAHLDWIPEHHDENDLDFPLTNEERQINYERYRIIVQNEFLGVAEEKFLNQIHVEEQFGSLNRLDVSRDRRRFSGTAAIGYNYESDVSVLDTPTLSAPLNVVEGEDDDSDIDLDICVDVSRIESSQAHEMNSVAQKYGLVGVDYLSFLTKDFEEAEMLRQARKQEEEKAMYSGRRSRRERRAFREKKMIGRIVSPPSYAARESPEYNIRRKSSSKSLSRSVSPANTGQITYITSFGSDEDRIRDEPPCVMNATNRKFKHLNKESSKALSLRLEKQSAHGRLPKKSRSDSYCRSRFRRSYDVRQSSPPQQRSKTETFRSKGLCRSRSPSQSRQFQSHGISSISRSRSRSHSRSSSRFISHLKMHSRAPSGTHSKSKFSRPICTRCSSSQSSSDSVSSRANRNPSKWSSSKSRMPRSRTPITSASRSSSQTKSRSRSKSSTCADPTMESRTKRKSQSKSPSSPLSSLSRSKRSRSTDDKTAAPRYYGRSRKSSSSETRWSGGEGQSSQDWPRASLSTANMHRPMTGLSTNSGGGHKDPKDTPQERLKKRMQALLNRQYKADKKAERARMEKMEQQRQDREDEIREMSLKLRRRQRERRHRYEDHSSDSHSSPCRSSSPKREARNPKRKDDRERQANIDEFVHHRDKERARKRKNGGKESNSKQESRRKSHYMRD